MKRRTFFEQAEAPMKRRTFLQAAAAIAAAIALPLRAARAARPDSAFAAERMEAAVASVYGGEYAESDQIRLKAPEIAENGAVVPVTVETDFPARGIAVLVEKNPQPLAAAFEFGDGGGGSFVSARLKMGESSTVLALAQTADGKVLGASKLVKVTIGGCGG